MIPRGRCFSVMKHSALLLGIVLVCVEFQVAQSVVLQDTTFSMSFRVQKDEFDRALAETKELLAFAEEKKMSPNTIMFIRAARDKVDSALKEFAKRQEEEAAAEARKQGTAPVPTTLTDKEIGVKSLKGEGAKKCSIKKYPASDLVSLLKNGKIDLRKPFIITGGMKALDMMRRMFTSENLLTNTELQLKYLSPVKAKEKRSFDKQQSHVPEDEQYEYSLVTMEKYFMNCFNLKAKPDFRKNGGADTEHCEQTVAAALLMSNTTIFDMFEKGVAGELAWLQKMEPGREWFAAKASDLQSLVSDKVDLKSNLQKSSSNFFTFGPAGSGEQLRQESIPFSDGLVHGKRRWFLMAPKDFEKLREKAKDVLEPASAFMFFEQQKEELEEDFGLGGKKMKFWECNQLPGEIIYIPSGTIYTSLNLHDGLSYKQNIATSLKAVAERVNNNIWAPETGVVPNGYQFGACFDYMDFASAGQKLDNQVNPLQGQIIQQIMAQYYPGEKAQNLLILNVLAECNSVMTAEGLDQELVTSTYCPRVWDICVSKLERNANSLGASIPSWLKSTPKPDQIKAEL